MVDSLKTTESGDSLDRSQDEHRSNGGEQEKDFRLFEPLRPRCPKEKMAVEVAPVGFASGLRVQSGATD
jgi:hypothetical protein